MVARSGPHGTSSAGGLLWRQGADHIRHININESLDQTLRVTLGLMSFINGCECLVLADCSRSRQHRERAQTGCADFSKPDPQIGAMQADFGRDR